VTSLGVRGLRNRGEPSEPPALQRRLHGLDR
jgi:hypothetical protein